MDPLSGAYLRTTGFTHRAISQAASSRSVSLAYKKEGQDSEVRRIAPRPGAALLTVPSKAGISYAFDRAVSRAAPSFEWCVLQKMILECVALDKPRRCPTVLSFACGITNGGIRREP